MEKMNKKGAELAISTVVVIILAILVLVFVIYYLATGGGNLFQNILGFGGGQVNVQTVVQSCKIACSTQATYDYCKKSRNVVFEEGQKGILLTCDSLELRNVGLDDCAGVDCGEVGVCSGKPTSEFCNKANNKGEARCVPTKACEWIDNPANPNPNIGNCELKEGVACDQFNDDELVCESLKCEWSSV